MVTDRLQRKIDDAKVEGWKVSEESGEGRVEMIRPNYGGKVAHILIFIFTLGFGTLPYLGYSYFFNSEKKVLRDEKYFEEKSE